MQGIRSVLRDCGASRVRPTRERSGRLNTLWVLLLGTAGLIGLLTLLLLQGGPSRQPAEQPLLMYCAAGLRGPVEQIVQQYEQEYGVRVELQYGGSNTLLNQLEVDQFSTVDLFLAADGLYIDQAVSKGLAAETLPIAETEVVVAVPKGNPRQIQSLDDLLRDDVTVAVPSPDQAAAGLVVRSLLQKHAAGDSNRWAQLEQHVTRSGVFKPTVNDVTTDVRIGAADAGFSWDFLVQSPAFRAELDSVTLPELQGAPSLVSVAVLKSSRQPTAALKFARYLTARDRGLLHFEEFGMRPVAGDKWAERPAITFFCGAVNRRVVEQLVAEFAEREGVDVNTIYDGCGTLTGRMKTIQQQRTDLGFPDVYMACDRYYLDNVADWFQDAANVSSAEIVLVVPKGSQQVRGIEDLVRPGVRVAVGEPDQCTIGALTRRLLVSLDLYERLKQKQQQPGEVVVEKPSSALLVPDVVTGHVDVAVAYITDTLSSREQIDILQIGSELNQAVQPLSIARSSDHKALVRRLYNRVTSAPDAFRAAGFEYRYKADNREQ